MKQKTIERNALIVSVFTNCIMTAAGLWVFLQTEIQALFLDFAFCIAQTVTVPKNNLKPVR